MDQSLVSIIIPCYNGEEFIERAISSVYSEDYPKVELIVVDDGSTDGSKNMILGWSDRFETKGWVLRYIYQENKGLGGAINTGLKYVTGEYLSLLDADDEYLPGAISERVLFLQAHLDVDVVRTNGWIIKGEHRRLFVTNEAEKQCVNIFVSLLRGETNNWAGSYMVRTSSLFKFYPEREIYTSRYGQNLQLLLPLVYRRRCGFVDKPYMRYIQQQNSLSQTSDAVLAQKRSLENAAGYRDIRVHMLRLIVQDEEQFSQYMRQIDGPYWRGVLHIASSFKDGSLLREAYKNLKEIEAPSRYDRIIYYRTVFPPASILIRVWNKLSRLFGDGYDNK